MTDPITVPERAPGDVPDFDHPRAEAAIRELLAAMGEDPEREGLLDTPARVAHQPAAQVEAGSRVRAVLPAPGVGRPHHEIDVARGGGGIPVIQRCGAVWATC